MVTTAGSVEWTVVANEVEALQLEYAWIKEFDPRFNVKYRDDKSYPYLAVTMGEDYPRVQVMRGAKRKGTRYFGPYSHAWAIRETVDQLLRVFPVRTCSAGRVQAQPTRSAGPACSATSASARRRASTGSARRSTARSPRTSATSWPATPTGSSARSSSEMRAAAAELDFERAARLRDDIGALERALARNAVVLGDATDADVFALAEDELEAAVQVFHVRGGRVRGQRGWVVEKVEDLSTPGLVEHLLQQVYGGESGDAVPREVLVPELPDDADDIAAWLGILRGLAGRPAGAAARRQAGADGDGRPQRRPVAGPAQAAARRRPDGAQPGPRGAAGGARPGRGAAADRVLRRLAPPGRRDGRLDGGLRGRPAAQERVPPVRDQGRRRQRRHRGDARGASPAGSGATSRSAPTWPSPSWATTATTATTGSGGPTRPATDRPASAASTRTPAGRASSPTRRSWSSSTAARRRSRPRPARWPSSASTTSRWPGWPSGWRRSGCPATTTRWSCRAPARGSTCCSGCATRRTGSRSPSTASAGPRR